MFDRMVRRVSDWVTLHGPKPVAQRQAGAIPYTLVDGQPVFLIITSRGTGRWIFPKGSPIDGLTPWQAAAREAFEEAGVEGDVEMESLGTYRTVKRNGLSRSVIEVELYPLRVFKQLDEWPEKGQRHRHWVTLPDARRLLSDPQLTELTKHLARRFNGKHQPAARLSTR